MTLLPRSNQVSTRDVDNAIDALLDLIDHETDPYHKMLLYKRAREAVDAACRQRTLTIRQSLPHNKRGHLKLPKKLPHENVPFTDLTHRDFRTYEGQPLGD
jgi:hypothetical protein